MSRETKGYVGFGIAEESRLKRLQGGGGMSVGGRRDRMRAGARRASGFCRAVATVFMLLCSLLVTAQAAETVTYYYTSPQGTVLATADSAGNILTSADYRPYGGQALGTPEDGPGYTGHVNDADSGLVYMQARYYDPEVGRFLSTDPASGAAGSVLAFSRFTYANNNPVMNVDPDGRQTVPGSIDWQAEGMMQSWQTTGREVTLPTLVSLAPGGGILVCAVQGCGGGEWAMAAVPFVGGELRGASRAINAGERMAQIASKGRRGEEAVRKVADIGEKVTINVNGRMRIPDGILEGVSLNEVKNVSRQGLTSQLRDYLQFARDPKNNLQFNLYTNEETRISQPLQELIDAGEINHYRLPME